MAHRFDKEDAPRSAGPRRSGLWGALQLGTEVGAAALRPAAGAVRLGRRAAAQAVDGMTLATADLVLNSRAAGEVAERLADSPLFERAVGRALAGPLVEAVSRDVVRYAVLDRVADTILRGDALEQATARLLDGPELERVVERVLESAAAERLVGQVIESRLLDETVRRLLESEDLWLLVDEIARSPAVTDAITRQSMSFADQVADGVRVRSRRADVWLERAARRALRRDEADDLPEGPAAGVTPP